MVDNSIFWTILCHWNVNCNILKTKFISLRVSGKDKNIFDSLDLDNISYSDIISSMNKLLQIDNMENNIEIGEIKR